MSSSSTVKSDAPLDGMVSIDSRLVDTAVLTDVAVGSVFDDVALGWVVDYVDVCRVLDGADVG